MHTLLHAQILNAELLSDVVNFFTTEILTNRRGFGCLSDICLIESNTKQVLTAVWFILADAVLCSVINLF